MTRRKTLKGYHVGDLVVYEGQRMRVAGFPTENMVVLTALVLVPGKPSHVKTSIAELQKKAYKVSETRSHGVTEEKE